MRHVHAHGRWGRRGRAAPKALRPPGMAWPTRLSGFYWLRENYTYFLIFPQLHRRIFCRVRHTDMSAGQRMRRVDGPAGLRGPRLERGPAGSGTSPRGQTRRGAVGLRGRSEAALLPRRTFPQTPCWRLAAGDRTQTYCGYVRASLFDCPVAPFPVHPDRPHL